MHTVQWPRVSDVARVRSIVAEIRAEMDSYLRVAISYIRAQDDAPVITLRSSTDLDLPWLLALYAHRYGVIYWIPRHEARALAVTVADEAAAIDAAGEYLALTGVGNTVFDFAVSCFVRSTRRRGHEVDRYVPSSGFQPTGAEELTYLTGEFGDLDPNAVVKGGRDARYDLHDFAHLTAARVCPELYRCHLRDLDPLPRHLVDLVAGFTAAEQPPHADGVLFSSVLTPLFARSPWPHLPDAVVVDWLAEQIVPYLLGEATDVGPGGTRPARPVHPLELAVLVQNKAYELPASEIEQHVFVRGGLDGHDSLIGLSSSERLRAIATRPGWTWNEARNVLKHRAHRQAYRTVVSYYLRGWEWDPHLRDLLVRTLAHVDYEDYHEGGRMNLFRLAGNALAWGPTPNSYEAV